MTEETAALPPKRMHVDAPFGDAEHRFHLTWKGLLELEEKTGEGPYVVFNRLARGGWRAVDVRETIRLGLIGGGMSAAEAIGLVGRYIEQGALLEHVPLAAGILEARIFGFDDEPAGQAA